MVINCEQTWMWQRKRKNKRKNKRKKTINGYLTYWTHWIAVVDVLDTWYTVTCQLRDFTYNAIFTLYSVLTSNWFIANTVLIEWKLGNMYVYDRSVGQVIDILIDRKPIIFPVTILAVLLWPSLWFAFGIFGFTFDCVALKMPQLTVWFLLSITLFYIYRVETKQQNEKQKRNLCELNWRPTFSIARIMPHQTQWHAFAQTNTINYLYIKYHNVRSRILIAKITPYCPTFFFFFAKWQSAM